MAIIKIKDRILSCIYPPRCPFCRELTANNEAICGVCRKILPFADDVCEKCGKYHCICHMRPLYFDSVTAVFLFENTVVKSIYRFKNYCKSYAESYAALMNERLLSNGFFDKNHVDFITYVPSDLFSYIGRGYSQTKLISKNLSLITGISFGNKMIIKKFRTKKQKDLNALQRYDNLRGAFICPFPELIRNKNFIVCDDVLTTGSTLSEIARTLKDNGAKEVHAATVATTVKFIK